MGKDINYDWGGFSRKWKSELVAQKGAWMEMRWPRPIWCFLGTLNWSQFPSLLRQPLTGSVSISFVLLVRFDEQSWWDNAPAKYNQLKWWNAQQMWIKRKRCKFLELTVWCDIWYTRLFGLSPSSIGSSDSEPWRLQGLAAVQVNLSLGGRPRFICCACFARNPKMSAFWGFYGVFPIYYSIT